MFTKLKSFFNSDFYNRNKFLISRIIYIILCFVIFFMFCFLVDYESIEYYLSLPLGLKCGILFLLYIFISPSTMNDIEQDEEINAKYDELLHRLECLESCAYSEEGEDTGENE